MIFRFALRKIRFIFYFILATSPVFADEYVVDINGNDNNPGTKALPFRSIYKASEMAMPDDTVTIRGGEYKLQEQFRPLRSGTSTQWILYRAAPDETAIFDGTLITKVLQKGDSIKFTRLTQGIFQIEKVNFIRFENIEVRNSNAAGFIVRGPECKKIELIGCKSNHSHNSGIGLWYCDSVRVINCEITGANDNGDEYYDPGQQKRREAPHEALSICGARFFEVANNHIHHCFKEGIDCKEVSKHGVIHHNLVHDLPRQAYYIDAWFGLLEDVEFYSNTAYDCVWGFGLCVEGQNSELRNVRIHHNLIYNMKGSGVLFGMWGSNGQRSDIHIYNNTFYHCGSPMHWSGGVGSIDILSKNFRDVFIYRNICDKGWDYEMGFTFTAEEVMKALKDQNFVAAENLFEGFKNRPSRVGQFDVMVYEYLPPGNQIGAPLYKNEPEFDFVPEKIPAVKPSGIKWKYEPSPWFGAFKPLEFATMLLFVNQNGGSEPILNPAIPDPVPSKVNIAIDKSTKYQTIEGFGFFGAADVWWAGAGSIWNDAWGEKAITDLGITMWRNEIYPPSTPGVNQDADWSKQKPVVQGLRAMADQHKVDLKFIATVWSPPADLKWECTLTWAGDQNATRQAGKVSAKNGGTLNPDKYTEYADWLKSNIQLYKDAGIDLYGLGLQNELMFRQTFNSCMYTSAWYNDMVNAVVPKIKTTYPTVKIYGSENMLEMEGKDNNWPVFYHAGIKKNATTSANIDVLAVHGYTDGVAPSTGSAIAKMWTNHTEQFSIPMVKPVWMTETSGYTDSWEKTGDIPGALNLALDMHAALFYGNISAWVWWQGSQGKQDEFSLMSGTKTGKKYSVSKQYYRYVRPGAVRVKSTASDPDLFVTAFENQAKGTYTIVIINAGSAGKAVTLTGDGLPATFKMYRTNSTSENCTFIIEVRSGPDNSFVIPAKTIVTLQAGGDAF